MRAIIQAVRRPSNVAATFALLLLLATSQRPQQPKLQCLMPLPNRRRSFITY